MTRLLTIIVTGLAVAGITAVTTVSGGQERPDLGAPASIEQTTQPATTAEPAATTEPETSDEAAPPAAGEQPVRRAEDSTELSTVDDDNDGQPNRLGQNDTSDNKASWITKVTRTGISRDVTASPATGTVASAD